MPWNRKIVRSTQRALVLGEKWNTKRWIRYSTKVQTKSPVRKAAATRLGVMPVTARARHASAANQTITGAQTTTTTAGWMWVRASRKSDRNNRIRGSLWLWGWEYTSQ